MLWMHDIIPNVKKSSAQIKEHQTQATTLVLSEKINYFEYSYFNNNSL